MKRAELTLAVAFTLCSAALAQEGRRADSILLNGPWEFVEGAGDEEAQTPAAAGKLRWQPTTLPGNFVPFSEKAATSVKFVWARRTFDATEQQAAKLAVLRWNHITFGAVAFINGRKVGENAPTGPYQVMLPKDVLKAGANTIVLKIPGAAGVAKSKSGFFLIPAGFASQKPRGVPFVSDDVWIDFADSAYIKWALAMPDLAASKVRIRVTPAGPEAINGLRITAQVSSWPDGKDAGKGEASAKFKPDTDPLGGEHTFVEVPMPGFRPWTHEDCNLYTAVVRLTRGGRTLDEYSFRFGMREITVADSRFRLNGRNLFLRGSDLVGEWTWAHGAIAGHEKDYLVTEAREMSMNSFRTHTQPPPKLWADIGDENGTMFMSEFPDLYNGVNHKFTPEEDAIFRANVLSDAAGWMARLWNHPSVITWVLSNESSQPGDRAWEQGPYQEFVLKLDPTRPTMRSGDGRPTKFIFDEHDCGNTVDTVELESLRRYVAWKERAKGLACTNSEYMNIFPRPLTQWTGVEDKPADALAYAQLGMEHTEAMRRLRFDGIWPYMYAGWTKTRTGREWRAGFAAPISAALHSALSPVLASLDLYNPDYLPAQEVTTDLWLINDSWHDAKVHVDVLLTAEDPQFVPEAKCLESPLAKWSFDFTLKADSTDKTPLKWKMPDKVGNYWLTARTTAVEPIKATTWSGRPVLSSRFVRAVRPPTVPDATRKRFFVVLGEEETSKAWFAAKGLKTSQLLNGVDDHKPADCAVIIWNAARISDEDRKLAKPLGELAAKGVKVVVLGASKWDWQELCDVNIGRPQGSRVFVQDGAGKHPLLAGIDPQWLMRWNGLPGLVATGSLKGPAMDKATRILWVTEPKCPVAADVPAAAGDGNILFLLLDIANHLDATKPNYDPAAENILLNAIGV
ncbi:MAG: glycoside hydrolase family 2 TIM barrel-domain containing protein [Phycisphaerae bacterium]